MLQLLSPQGRELYQEYILPDSLLAAGAQFQNLCAVELPKVTRRPILLAMKGRSMYQNFPKNALVLTNPKPQTVWCIDRNFFNFGISIATSNWQVFDLRPLARLRPSLPGGRPRHPSIFLGDPPTLPLPAVAGVRRRARPDGAGGGGLWLFPFCGGSCARRRCLRRCSEAAMVRRGGGLPRR